MLLLAATATFREKHQYFVRGVVGHFRFRNTSAVILRFRYLNLLKLQGEQEFNRKSQNLFFAKPSKPLGTSDKRQKFGAIVIVTARRL
jgi:hypothetical protein